jgi:hypothetical protein
MRKKRTVVAVVFLALVGALMWQTVYRPRKIFRLGMPLSEIEPIVGNSSRPEPLGSAIRSPENTEENARVPFYRLRLRTMGTDLYLNMSNEVIFIDFLLGPDPGEKRLILPPAPNAN